jgi:hypothetical protein
MSALSIVRIERSSQRWFQTARSGQAARRLPDDPFESVARLT